MFLADLQRQLPLGAGLLDDNNLRVIIHKTYELLAGQNRFPYLHI